MIVYDMVGMMSLELFCSVMAYNTHHVEEREAEGKLLDVSTSILYNAN